MGRPRKIKSDTALNNTPSGKHVFKTVQQGEKVKPEDPIEAKNAEKAQEAKLKAKANANPAIIKQERKVKPIFETQLLKGYEKNSWISNAFEKFFGILTCGYRENVKRWDFPYSIEDKFKRHCVYRQYFYKKVMVDIFDKGTPISEIRRIKAHLEALGFTYTYVIGGEEGIGSDEWATEVFENRLKPLDPKAQNYPKFHVPTNLEEAKFAGHQMVKV